MSASVPPPVPAPARFNGLARFLHWTMALLLLAMVFIGLGMVASLGNYHRLLALHRPLGIAILLLALVRLANRLLSGTPPLPSTMSAAERKIAVGSERLFYLLMIALPLVGWGMLSAGGFPIVLCGSLRLPAILPAHPFLFAALRKLHTVLAYGLFALFLAHLGAVLFHTLVVRDGLLWRMAPWLRPRSVGGAQAQAERVDRAG